MTPKNKLSEAEFARICNGIDEDRDSIIKHNPIGTPDETLLWMLLSCLVSYLSIDDAEIPCFTGRPDAATYQNAISFMLKDRRIGNFDPAQYLNKLTG